METTGNQIGQADTTLLLYHGSDVLIEQPDVSLNTGYSDLGRGFYLTDDHDAARRRALSRARRTGAPAGVVSVFELDVADLVWVTMGGQAEVRPGTPSALRFGEDAAGVAAWIGYIGRCRQGRTGVEPAGEPAIVRAWIATEEVEMALSGMVSPEEVARFVEPGDLTVQYCLRDQDVLDARLRFVGSEPVGRTTPASR